MHRWLYPTVSCGTRPLMTPGDDDDVSAVRMALSRCWSFWWSLWSLILKFVAAAALCCRRWPAIMILVALLLTVWPFVASLLPILRFRWWFSLPQFVVKVSVGLVAWLARGGRFLGSVCHHWHTDSGTQPLLRLELSKEKPKINLTLLVTSLQSWSTFSLDCGPGRAVVTWGADSHTFI